MHHGLARHSFEHSTALVLDFARHELVLDRASALGGKLRPEQPSLSMLPYRPAPKNAVPLAHCSCACSASKQTTPANTSIFAAMRGDTFFKSKRSAGHAPKKGGGPAVLNRGLGGPLAIPDRGHLAEMPLCIIKGCFYCRSHCCMSHLRRCLLPWVILAAARLGIA
jgi:hypothetical protein